MDVMELSARFLGSDGGQIRLFFFDASVRKTVVESQEFKGEWKTAEIGAVISVRLSNEYVDAYKLLAGKTYTTGGEKRDVPGREVDDRRPRPQ